MYIAYETENSEWQICYYFTDKKKKKVTCFICLLEILEATWSTDEWLERLKVDNHYLQGTSLPRLEIILPATVKQEARFSF